MAAKRLAWAAQESAGLFTRRLWHAAVAAAAPGVGGSSAPAFAFEESDAPLKPLGIAPGSGAALGCPLPAPSPLTC
jgi:hypothetical protein